MFIKFILNKPYKHIIRGVVEYEKRYIKCNNSNGGGEKFGK